MAKAHDRAHLAARVVRLKRRRRGRNVPNFKELAQNRIICPTLQRNEVNEIRLFMEAFCILGRLVTSWCPPIG
jgi:hypothetical protein